MYLSTLYNENKATVRQAYDFLIKCGHNGGVREKGTGNRKKGTGNREQGTGMAAAARNWGVVGILP